MAQVEFEGSTYELTNRKGMPAIRKLNRLGETARWVPLGSDLGKAIMRKSGKEPAMAPGFAAERDAS